MSDTRSTRSGMGRLGALVAATGMAFGLAVLLNPGGPRGEAAAAKPAAKAAGGAGMKATRGTPVDDFVPLGFKFDGAQSCSNANCHGAPERKEGAGATTLAEFTEWSADDRHSKAFETLTNAESQAIAGKLKIADASTSARCTNCHAMPAPEKLQGEDFNMEEGVSCAACHGPSEKWREPHAEEGWTEKMRQKHKTHGALLKATGLYDTKNTLARATNCTSCHLAIETDLVAAGHPQPAFELAAFSSPDFYQSRHWRDPAEAFYTTRLWATGQAVATRDAMRQLAARAAGKDAKATQDALQQAMAHYTMFKAVGAAVKADSKALDAAATALAGAKGPEVAKQATAAAAAAEKLAPTVAAGKFTAASTAQMLQAAAAADVATKYGEHGMTQQSYSILSLYDSYAAGAKAPDAEATREAILDALFPEEPLKPAAFAKAVASVRAKLPKK